VHGFNLKQVKINQELVWMYNTKPDTKLAHSMIAKIFKNNTLWGDHPNSFWPPWGRYPSPCGVDMEPIHG